MHSAAIAEYAVVDHGHDMADAGHPGHSAWTLIFGNPQAGAALLDQDPAAAVDIPLRLAVIGRDATHSTIVLRPMETLVDGEIAPKLTAVLRALVSEAR